MLSAKVNLPKVDIEKTVKAVHEYMTKFTIDTMSKWVTGATDPVPVWSGASRASFLKLANAAGVEIVINPVVKSRIPLGIETSTGVVFADPGRTYGWEWTSDLFYIAIVDQRVGFVEAGLRTIERARPELPALVYTKAK